MCKPILTRARRISSDKLNQAAIDKCNKADLFIMKNQKLAEPDLEEIKKALKLYQEAAIEEPNLIQPYIGIAYISQSSGNIELAIGLLNKAHQLQPSNQIVNEMLDELNKLLNKPTKINSPKEVLPKKNLGLPEFKKKNEFSLDTISKIKRK
ncbi:MAG: hypothetical protein U0457_20705 [Candidatus Sericytochromatia bacterium]